MTGRGKVVELAAQNDIDIPSKITLKILQGLPFANLLIGRVFFRMSALVYNETRAVLNVFVGNLVQDAVVYTEHANRKTATKVDGRPICSKAAAPDILRF
ncbi:hypothetical protein JG687_00008528 [Phytophthora cactorum]|uniref:Histone H4 n=1 Tax=Phytophthora cactorum TaxID=29920 RepID=A0A8T1UDL3_9STRA|nr:hypothetical protein JG687_00008528 [Phytophthora cactorum]